MTAPYQKPLSSPSKVFKTVLQHHFIVNVWLNRTASHAHLWVCVVCHVTWSNRCGRKQHYLINPASHNQRGFLDEWWASAQAISSGGKYKRSSRNMGNSIRVRNKTFLWTTMFLDHLYCGIGIVLSGFRVTTTILLLFGTCMVRYFFRVSYYGVWFS